METARPALLHFASEDIYETGLGVYIYTPKFGEKKR